MADLPAEESPEGHAVTQRYMVLILMLALLMLAKCEDPNPWSDPGRRAVVGR